MAQTTLQLVENGPASTLLSSLPMKRVIREGDDVEIDETEVPYEYQGTLGIGGHAFVEKVRDVLSGSVFARKTFKRNRRASNRVKAMLECEVDNIRALAPHPHVIRIYATYITRTDVAMLLQPVADMNLADFLANFRDLSDTDPDKQIHRDIIFRGFGCLAYALEYMHRGGFRSKPIIRHKDIKAKNVLLHEGYMMFTDFGISKSCARDHTTTDGRPESFTAMFCAPEVANHDQRNRKSDVFSLGCVFLEMLAALYPDEVPDDLLSDHSSEPYHRQIYLIQSCLRAGSVGPLAGIVHHMFNESPKNRPSASDVTSFLEIMKYISRCDRCSAFDARISSPLGRLDPPIVFGNNTTITCRPMQILFRNSRYGCPYPHCPEMGRLWLPLSVELDFSVQSFTCGFCKLTGTLYGTWRDLWRTKEHLEMCHADDFPLNWVAIQSQLPFGTFDIDLVGNFNLGLDSTGALDEQIVMMAEENS